MMEWRPIATAPKDGTVFLALNADLEVHVARYFDGNRDRFSRRSHQQRWSQTLVHEGDRKYLTEETFHFDTAWAGWTKGYEFAPTHWMPLPPPPSDVTDAYNAVLADLRAKRD